MQTHGFHDKTPSGTLFVRITSDVEDITTFFRDVVSTIVKDIVMIIALIMMMVILDYKLSLVCLIIIPLVTITSIIINNAVRKIEEKSKKIKTKLNIFLSESIYGVKLIKIFGREREKEKECEELCEDFCKSRIPSGRAEAFLIGLMNLFQNLGVAIIVWACVKHFLGITLEVRSNLHIHNIHKANIRTNTKNSRKLRNRPRSFGISKQNI